MIKPYHTPDPIDLVTVDTPEHAAGQCVPYAVAEAQAHLAAGCPPPRMVIVEGKVYNHFARQHIPHMWIERGGYAYDWQTFALDGGSIPTVAEFIARYDPRTNVRFVVGVPAGQ